MRICFSGLDTPCCVQPVTIDVSLAPPLIQLAQVIPWQARADRVLTDLKRPYEKFLRLQFTLHIGSQMCHNRYPAKGMTLPGLCIRQLHLR